MTNPYLIRDAVIEDAAEISALLVGLGLNMPAGPNALNQHWQQMWVDNPAMGDGGKKPMIGKVLEKNGAVVGFFGNIPLRYFFGDEPVSLSAAIHWGVEKEARTETSRLAEAYFDQPDADVLLVTTTNRAAGRLFLKNGYLTVPQPDYDQALYWITGAAGFMEAALRKKGLPSGLAVPLSAMGGLLAKLAMAVTRRRPKASNHPVQVIEVGEIDDSFDDLWAAKRGEAKRLLACRSADSLRWHFGVESLAQRCRFLVYRDQGLKGYLAVLRQDSPEIGLKRLRIVDLFVANDDEVVVDALLSEAYEFGKQTGCHILEVIGLPAAMRQRIVYHRPFVRRMPTWPLYYRPAEGELAQHLELQAAWYVTPYDGDTSLL
ncbi:MAG: hypothetical protein ISR45_01905 [Rhodospirillales bacterium]|nr:hypothetical protein [Rhodospirillales bacterium]